MQKVLLTGVSGFIGLHCAAELIKAGYYVKGSLRNLAKGDAILGHLNKVVDAKGKIEFVQLDLLKDDGWNEAAADCDFVMHVASPFFSKEPKNPDELVKPAVEGTLRALNAAKKAGVKRVVLTSSMVAMLGELNGDLNINQSSWTNTNSSRITAYLKSKTLAEKAAWEFVKANNMELTTIHPGPVYGPPLSNNLEGESMNTIKNIIQGKVPMLLKSSINMSDVRDVAKIHVEALENKNAAGQRFVVASEESHAFIEITNLLKANGYKKAGAKEAPNFLLRFMGNFNSEMRGFRPYIGNDFKASIADTKQTFSWQPVPFDKMLLDTAKAVQAIIQ